MISDSSEGEDRTPPQNNSSSQRTSSTHRNYVSPVWTYFRKTSEAVICLRCNRHFGLKTGTSSLRFHADKCSPLSQLSQTSSSSQECDAGPSSRRLVGKKRKIQARMDDFTTGPRRPLPSSEQEVIDKLFVEMLWKDLRPFTTLEGEGFVNIVRALNPRAVIKSRRTYVRILEKQYAEHLVKLKEVLAKVEYGAICFDFWTSNAKHAYLTVTLHWITDDFECEYAVLDTVEMPDEHTAANTARKVSEIVENRAPNTIIDMMVTDNAPNVLNVAEHLVATSVSCFGHTLQLCINNGLKVRLVFSIFNVT